MMNVSARDHPGHLILFRTYVSRKAAGKGRAVLEGVGLDSETIDACFNGSNEEEAVQAGLTKWCGGRGYKLATWGVLFAAMEYAQLAQQHVHDLKKESGLFADPEESKTTERSSAIELSRKRQRSSTRSSDDLAPQQSVAKKCLHDYMDLKMDLLAQDIADLHSKCDPSDIIKLLYSNFLFRIAKLLTPHFSEVKIAADNHCQLGLHPKAVAEGAIGSAGSVDNLLNLMSVKTMWEDTCFFRKAVAAIPASAPERQVADAILLHYNTHLDIFNRATLLRDALAKETKIDEKKTGSNEDDKMIPLKITSAKPNIGFTREDCYRILEQLLSRAYGIPPGKIICQDTYESNSTTVTFVIPSQYMHDIIQCSMLLPTVWVLLELDIIEVSIPGVFTFIPSVGCFLSLLRGSKPFTADLLEVTEVLPYQTYCLLDPNTKVPLSDRPLSTKRIEQHWDSHVGLVPDPHCSVLESGGIDILATHSEEAVVPPEGSNVDTTDDLQSKVGELEDKVTDLERKVANLFMDNVALTTKLKASRGVEKEQQEEIAHLKERLVQALRAQDTATQELSLLRTRESELEEKINMLEETRSDLEVEVETFEKQMKQLEILPSDVEQLAKQLAAKEGECRQKDERNREKDEVIREKSAAIQAQQAKIQQLRDQLVVFKQEVLPQYHLPPSLRKEVRNMKLPDMPMGAASYAATIHNSKVYISAFYRDRNGKLITTVLVYSTDELKWSTLPGQRPGAAIAVVIKHVTLIGGMDVSTGKVTNTLSTLHEEEGRWIQVLSPMPTGRYHPSVIYHDNFLLVTGGVADDVSTVLNTTDVLDLTTMKWSTPEGLNVPIPLHQHRLALCGEYLYLLGGTTVYPRQSPEDYNSQAWRAKWSDVKQTAAPQHSQPQRDVWTQIGDPPSLCPTLISCEWALYTVGGVTRVNKPISTVYTYIPARNQWVSVGDMSVGRFWHCAVPLSSNTIFVAGGNVVNEGKWAYSLSTELLLL